MKKTSKKTKEVVVTMSKAAFNKLTKEKKRVIVAQDVLDRIDIGQFVPTEGIFCSIRGDSFKDTPENKNVKIKTILENPKQECYVCAKGGLFMAYVGINNGFKIKDLTQCQDTLDVGYELWSDEMKSLKGIFSEKQLSLIELTFEAHSRYTNEFTTLDDISKCYTFHGKYSTDTQRLIAICNNIIKNKGTFKP